MEDTDLGETIRSADADFAQQAEQRQSVRTTLNLKEEALEAKEWLSSYYGISQKALLDLVLEVLKECFNPDEEGLLTKEEVLEMVSNRSSSNTTRKSHAVSRETRTRLTDLSEEYDVSRDGLIEIGLKLLKAFVQVQIQRHEEVLEQIEAYYERGQKLEEKLQEDLGSEDPVRDGFSRVMLSLEMLQSQIEEEIEHGSPIDTSGM